MRILVVSRTEAKHLMLNVKYAVVSLCDPGDAPDLPPNFRMCGFHVETFHDLDPVAFQPAVLAAKVMDEDQARRIVEFVSGMRDFIAVLVIHCFAGLGRSPSVAMALTDGLNLGRAVIDWGGRDPHQDPPNKHVYRLVREALAARGPTKEGQA